MKKDVFMSESYIDAYNVDTTRAARPAGILREMQECGSRQMSACKPSYDELLDRGQALMLSRLDMVIPEDVFLDDKIKVYTWPCPSTRATFLRNYVMYRDEKLVADISSQWTLVDMASRKILKVEDVDFSNYVYDQYHEVISSSKLKISKDELAQMESAGTKEVMLSDVDYNGHMNNTYYIDMLCDRIPELAHGEYRVSAFRIHFSKEAPLNEKIEIKRLRADENRYLFCTYREDGQVNVEAEIFIEKRKGA